MSPGAAASPSAPTRRLTRVGRLLTAPGAKEAVTVMSAAVPSGKGRAASEVNRTRPVGCGGWKTVPFGSRKVKSPVAPSAAVSPSNVKKIVVSRSDRLPPGPPYSGRTAVTATSTGPSSSPAKAGETVKTANAPAQSSVCRAPEGNPTSSTPERSRRGRGPVIPLPQKPSRDREPPAVGDREPQAAGTEPVNRLSAANRVRNLVKEPKAAGREPWSWLPERSRWVRPSSISSPAGKAEVIPVPLRSKKVSLSTADGQVVTPRTPAGIPPVGQRTGLPPASKWVSSVSAEKDAGRPPVNPLSPKISVSRRDRSPIRAGMGPVSRLPPKSRTRN